MPKNHVIQTHAYLANANLKLHYWIMDRCWKHSRQRQFIHNNEFLKKYPIARVKYLLLINAKDV